MTTQKASHRRIAADKLRESLEMDGMNTSALSSIFREEPPDLETFLYDAKYLNHLRPTIPYADTSGYAFKLSEIQYDFVRNFEQIFEPELYIAMVEEFGDKWSPLPMKNMFSVAWGKGCPVAGEKVYSSDDGQWRNIEDVVSGINVAATDTTTGAIVSKQGTESWVSGTGECFEVETSSGAKTRVYGGHKFYTPNGWKELWDIEERDFIANAYRLPINSPSELPDNEVELIGFWLGDGCLTSSTHGIRMYFNEYEENSYGRYMDILSGLGLSPQLKAEAAHGVTVSAGTGRTVCANGHPMTSENSYVLPTGKSKCRTCRKDAADRKNRRDRGEDVPVLKPGRKEGALTSIARKYGVLGMNAHTKRVPKEIFSLPNHQIYLFLSRLFGTDGWVEPDRIRYCSVNRDLVEDVYLLLKRIGVRSTITKKRTTWTHKGEKNTSSAFVLTISAVEDILAFNSQVILLDKFEKQAAQTLRLANSKGRVARHGDLFWDRVVRITSIGEHEYYDLSVPELENYVSTDGLVAHNSGKDSTVRIGFARIASLLQHMHSPQSYFKMASFDNIHMLNVAVNAQQARDAFFDPMKKLFTTNKYLSEMFHGDDPAEGASRLRLKNNLTIISGHSLAENQEGLNLIAGVADEISAFKTAEEYGDRGGRSDRGADAIVGMLQSSASSRFPNTYKVAQISWPRFYNDAISKALDKGRNSIETYGNEKSQWYVSGPYATWDVNPKVSRESLQEHFDSDPEKASAMYAARPPRSTNVFIRNEIAIDAAFDTVKPEPITVDYYWGQPPRHSIDTDIPDSLKPQDGWQVSFGFNDLEPVEGALYCLHGDMAIKGDRAGIAMSHVKSWRESSDEAGELPVVKNDFTFSFESDLKDREHPREVQIRWYRQLIWELIERGFQIATVTFDQFQSTSMIQSLNQHGIDSGLLSLDRNDKVYQEFKDIVLDYRLEGYRSSEDKDPRYVSEIKRLRKTGKKVDHPPSGCFVGSTRIPLLDGTYQQIEDLAGKEVWVYSATPEGKIVPGRARGRFTKEVTNLVDVVLDNGYVARCTPEHLWMLRDGTYKMAQDLEPAVDRLMPITINWPVNGGYTRVTDKDGIRTLAHHMVAEYFAGRSREKDEIVHHVNEVKTDNTPDNLEIMSRFDHVLHHAIESWGEEKKNAFREGYQRWISDEEKKRAVYSSRVLSRERSDVTIDSILDTIRRGSDSRAQTARMLKCDWNVVNSRLKAEGVTFDDLTKTTNNNHKVRAVIPVTLDSPVPVYDLEVDTWDNFALSGGVFVHNSKDESDALAGSVFNAITVGGSEEESFSMMEMNGGMSPDDMLLWHSPNTGGNDFGLFGSGGSQSNSLGFSF